MCVYVCVCVCVCMFVCVFVCMFVCVKQVVSFVLSRRVSLGAGKGDLYVTLIKTYLVLSGPSYNQLEDF